VSVACNSIVSCMQHRGCNVVQWMPSLDMLPAAAAHTNLAGMLVSRLLYCSKAHICTTAFLVARHACTTACPMQHVAVLQPTQALCAPATYTHSDGAVSSEVQSTQQGHCGACCFEVGLRHGSPQQQGPRCEECCRLGSVSKRMHVSLSEVATCMHSTTNTFSHLWPLPQACTCSCSWASLGAYMYMCMFMGFLGCHMTCLVLFAAALTVCQGGQLAARATLAAFLLSVLRMQRQKQHWCRGIDAQCMHMQE
jgi:hypothetical protein